MSATIDKTNTSVSIETGGLDVITNGSVLFLNNEVKFNISDLQIHFHCKSAKGNKQEIDSEVSEEGVFNIYLTNFNSSLGAGNKEVLKIGRMRNRKLYMSFATYIMNEDSLVRKIDYTFYLGDKINE